MFIINVYSIFFTARTGCFKAFGMESNKIPDSQITASSYKRYYEPHQARLHMTASASGNGAWCASTSYQQGEWLQVSSSIYKTVCFLVRTGAVTNLIDLVDSSSLGCFCHLDCETISIAFYQDEKEKSSIWHFVS